MTQREKDYQHARSMCLLPAPAYAFADGAEYGRADLAAQVAAEQAAPLAKLERLIWAGWRIDLHGLHVVLERQCDVNQWERVRGATLAEALAQVEDP